jgi:type I restriction enzyme S subunit
LDYNQKQLETIASGSSQKNLLLRQLASFRIVLPSISEQQKIGSVLSNVDELIQGHQKNKSSLEILKKGLMQQLLSGKIRVKV